MPSDTIREILERQCYAASGTKVTNCVRHMHLDLTERPTSCELCAADVRNRLSDAIAVNEWLNKWKDDASAILEATREQAVEQIEEHHIQEIEDEELTLIGRLAEALGHDGKEAVGVDQLIEEVQRLKQNAR
jgi:hypothetical protein